jgi:hypothetical protein
MSRGAGFHVLSQHLFEDVGGDLFASGSDKNQFLRGAFSYAVLNCGDGGVGPQVPLIFGKRSNSKNNDPAVAETPP